MITIQATRKDVRKFGMTFAILTLVIASFAFYKGSDSGMWFLGGSVFFLATGLLAYPVLKPIYIGWMTFAHALAWVNTRIIMSISFYLLMTPVGLIFRILKKDLLGIRLDKQASSYWVKRDPAVFEAKRYEQSF